jgi:hypothetical protein
VVDTYDPVTGQPVSTTVEFEPARPGPEDVTSYVWHPSGHLATATTETWRPPDLESVRGEEYAYDDQWRPMGFRLRIDGVVERSAETTWQCP